MAFSTIQGSGSAPDSFVGTSGVDTISLVNSPGDFVLTAFADDDDVQFLGSGGAPAIVDATLKGGDGDDDFLGGVTELFSNVFINGNADDDTLDFLTTTTSGSTFANSTLKGGKGDDDIDVWILNQSLVNGNMDDDEIDLGFVTSSSVFGGQGADYINIEEDLVDSIVNGDDGNDGIDVHTDAFTTSTVYGGDGQDTIDASQAAGNGVVISGDAGNDRLVGSDLADTILGGDGNDSTTGGAQADTLTGGAGVNTYVYAAANFGVDAATRRATVVAGTIDTITDFKNTGSASTTDFISGVFSTSDFTNEASVAAVGYATYAAALTAAEASDDGSAFLAAVGSSTSWTAYLFQNTTAASATDVSAAVQLGTTGQFGTAALANASIIQAQIIA